MFDPNWQPKDIADKLIQMRDPNSAHDALLKDVNDYFSNRIQELKQKATIPFPDGRPHDLRGDVIALFNNVATQTDTKTWRDDPNGQTPYNVEFFDLYTQKTDKGTNSELKQNQSPSNRNQLPYIFQFRDPASRLSFSIETSGQLNPDYLYQSKKQEGVTGQSPYKTWSQYYGAGKTSSVKPYQPGSEGRSKYEFR